MKANELMIGDWVRIDEPDKYAGATGQIQSLMYHREDDAAYFNVFIQGRFGYVSRDVCSDDIRPITLTAEILEKNGFEKQWQDNYEYFDDDENLNMTFHPKSSNYTNGAYDYINIEKGCLTINEMPIEFVHELQRVLRILGTNKDIVL